MNQKQNLSLFSFSWSLIDKGRYMHTWNWFFIEIYKKLLGTNQGAFFILEKLNAGVGKLEKPSGLDPDDFGGSNPSIRTNGNVAELV